MNFIVANIEGKIEHYVSTSDSLDTKLLYLLRLDNMIFPVYNSNLISKGLNIQL